MIQKLAMIRNRQNYWVKQVAAEHFKINYDTCVYQSGVLPFQYLPKYT